MQKQALKYLEDLGLKDNEAQVYITCLKRPMGLHVHEIVHETDLKRSTIDLILSRLQKEGFISSYVEGKRKIFIAEKPEKIIFSQEQKIQNFKSFLPGFMESITKEKKMPFVRYYEGINGIEKIYDDILLTCQSLPAGQREIQVITAMKQLYSLLPDHNKKFIHKRIRRGISLRVLAPRELVAENLLSSSTKALRQSRFFDEEAFPYSISMEIYGDKLALLNLCNPDPSGTIIEGKMMADSMRSLFEIIWAQAQTHR